jgi:methylated-DNA-[protein]-cysteine S-methyltransferase
MAPMTRPAGRRRRAAAGAQPNRQNGAVRALSWTTISTPAGQLSVGCSEAGLAAVRFGGPPSPAPGSSPASLPSPAPGSSPSPGAAGSPGDSQSGPGQILASTCAQLSEYFAGQRRVFDLPIDWTAVSRPQCQVLSVLLDSVGYGETVTYGTLASRAGSAPGATTLPARAIGRIMGSNPVPVIVPCHRVVAGNGLGGFSGGIGPELKRWLLIFEGALPPTLDWKPAGPA